MLNWKAPLIATSILLLGACGDQQSAGGARVPASAIPVTTMIVEPSTWVDSFQAVGTTKARESVTLTAKITETVRKVNFEDGQHVDAGDVLVEMTAGQQVAALAEAQASYKDAERLMQRNDDLVAKGTVSQQVADTARSTQESSKARVNFLRAQLSDRVVTAPFSGVLGLRQVSVGALVSPGTVITTLDNIETITVDFAMPERFLAALSPGLDVQTTSVAYPGRTFDGTIVSVDSRVDPVTRAILVRAEIPNEDQALRAGMLLTVRVLRPARELIAVPEIVVEQIGTESFVYVVGDDDTVKRVKVVLGARQGGNVEVAEGLDAGTRIVRDGTVKLREGSKVVDASRAGAEAE